MKHYEGMFVTHNKEAKKDTAYLSDHVKGLIEKVGGSVIQLVKWDERKLAYPIKGVSHGVYFLTWFSSDSAAEQKLRQEVRLSGLILRHLVMALESAPEGQLETFTEMQARMSSSDRKDDLDFGGDMGGGGGGGSGRREMAYRAPVPEVPDIEELDR